MSIISKLALLLCFQTDLKCPFTCCNGNKPLKVYLKSELIAKGLISSKCGKMTKRDSGQHLTYCDVQRKVLAVLDLAASSSSSQPHVSAPSTAEQITKC